MRCAGSGVVALSRARLGGSGCEPGVGGSRADYTTTVVPEEEGEPAVLEEGDWLATWDSRQCSTPHPGPLSFSVRNQYHVLARVVDHNGEEEEDPPVPRSGS
ncbi:zinc finger and BTB domain-containing protein 41 [Platysternon megacephalum]|uniref:Zinc finger and BTB domain-containing protein 41 n=1 Tax=Platysternon megacephalum TaxID=55544 RepID=A0A4D9EW36_9SAUR|nr:zinc finger and BTB domain-containing protein 41 [Platysternon megacephalum]